MKRILVIITLLTGITHADQPRAKDIVKLESYIQEANVKKFRAIYDSVDNKQDIKPLLLVWAHNTRKELSAELALIGDKKSDTKKLLIGTLQALCFLYCLDNMIDFPYSVIKDDLREYTKDVIDAVLAYNKLYYIPRYPAAILVSAVHRATRPTISYPLGVTLCGALTLLTYKAWKASAKNIKQGINYPAYLKQQIKNLDEIIAYIQNPTVAPAIEEAV
jgi:hypothetical protein